MFQNIRKKLVRHFTWQNADDKRILRKGRILWYSIAIVFVAFVVSIGSCVGNEDIEDFTDFKNGVSMAQKTVLNQDDSVWLKAGLIRKTTVLSKIEASGGKQSKWFKEGAMAYLNHYCKISLMSIRETEAPTQKSLWQLFLTHKYSECSCLKLKDTESVEDGAQRQSAKNWFWIILGWMVIYSVLSFICYFIIALFLRRGLLSRILSLSVPAVIIYGIIRLIYG